MGRIVLILLALWFVEAASAAGMRLTVSSDSIEGHWQFYKISYRGEDHPPFNPDLVLTWEFLPSGYELLGWERHGQSGSCLRLAKYTYKAPWLTNEVVWVDPENAIDCALDPDMQMGRKSVTKVTRSEDDLWLHLSINEEPLIYIFKRIRVLSSSGDR